MQRVTRIALPKEQLHKLTASERSLFLLLGYASNQINTLWKLIVVATNPRWILVRAACERQSKPMAIA
jgi:hypothetical protein